MSKNLRGWLLSVWTIFLAVFAATAFGRRSGWMECLLVLVLLCLLVNDIRIKRWRIK